MERNVAVFATSITSIGSSRPSRHLSSMVLSFLGHEIKFAVSHVLGKGDTTRGIRRSCGCVGGVGLKLLNIDLDNKNR